MPQGFNYAKWDKLELSDDEDNHPGAKFIEENTLRRIKRESHETKEAERTEKVAALTKQIKKDKKRIKEIEAAAHANPVEVTDAAAPPDAAGSAELAALRSDVAKNVEVVNQEEKERKFNADEMCFVSSERSLVGAACKSDNGDENLDYEAYAKKYGSDLDVAATRSFADYGDMGEFFKARPDISLTVI